MHTRFALLLTVSFIAPTLALAQVTVTDTREGGKPVPKPAPFNMKSASQAPLRNQDVIQMVKSGQQQASIIAVLRSRRGSFDLSPQGCASLRAANVSQGILNTMGGSGGAQCTSSMPSPGSVQNQHNLSGGTLLGNQKSTLLGNHGAATATPSNTGDPVSLNPQPLPPRTGKSTATSSARTTKIKSSTGTPGTVGTSPTPQQ
jgi:hypothetical protein